MQTHGGQTIPYPRSASARTAAAQLLATSPALVSLGSVTIPGGGIPKIILFSVNLSVAGGAGDAPGFRLFRNGVEIDATDFYITAMAAVAPDTKVVSCHWHDPTPGAGPVTYDVRAGSANGLVTAGNRRVTVQHDG